MDNNELKIVSIKNHTCYYFDGRIRVEDFDFDNILSDEKSFKNILAYNISYKTLISTKPLHVRFDEQDGFIKVSNGTRYLILCDPKNMIPFTIGFYKPKKRYYITIIYC